MTYKPVKIPHPEGPITAIVCDRSKKKAAPCDEPHCGNAHVYLCDYPVTRDGQEGTCDRKLCRRHAVTVGKDRDYCPAHARARGRRVG